MPPKKNQKVSLTDFLNDESTGKVNWADDIDDLPTAPSGRGSDDRFARRGGDYLSTVPDRADRDRMMGPRSSGFDEDREPRRDLPLPDKPPYTAFVGNLSFEVTEDEVKDFFPGKNIKVRLVERDGRPKGFGYVEFDTLDDLKDGLSLSGSQMGSRTVRVSVAEPPKSGFGGSSMAEEASQWRRAGPLPPADPPARRGPPGGGDRPSYNRFESSASTGGGFDAMEVGAGGRSGFGSKFTPAPAGVRDAPPHGAPRTPRVGADGGPPPPLEPSQGDEASNWRTGKPVETPVEARRPSSGVTPGGADRAQSFRGGDATQVDERYAGQERMGFGSKFAATPPESPSGGAGKRAGFGFAAGRAGPPGAPGAGPSAAPVTPTAGDEADTWRNAARRPAPARGPSQGPAAGAPPAERKKLELKPRSTPTPAAEGGEAPSTPLSPTGEQSSSGRANPFGNAKPVDAAERERLIEEKMAAREKERKEQREKEQAERIAERQAAQDAAPKGPRGDRNKPAGAAAEGGAASPAPAGAPTGPRASGSAGNAWRREPSASSPSVPAGPAADAKKTSAPSSEKGSSQAEAVASPPAPAAAAAAPVAPPKPAPTGAWGGGRKPSGALNLPSGATSPAAGSGSATPAAQEKGEAEKSEAASEVQAATEGVAAASLDEKSA